MPLLWLSLAFLTGLVLGEALSFAWYSWAGLAALCLGLAFVERQLSARLPAFYQRVKAQVRLPLALVLAALMLGGARQALAHQPARPGDLAYYNGDGVTSASALWSASRRIPVLQARSSWKRASWLRWMPTERPAPLCRSRAGWWRSCAPPPATATATCWSWRGR